jgi:hypothetical protein
MSYIERVCETIIPLSVSDDCKKALKEWYFTENTIDHLESTEECELCGQDGLRYHFEICNSNNKNKLEVGSQCILQFDISVYSDGSLLDKGEAKKKLSEHMRRMRYDSCIRALKNLKDQENWSSVKNILERYESNGVLTPKEAFLIFWRLKQNKIDHDPSFFKVSLRKHKHQRDLKEMQTERVHFFGLPYRQANEKKPRHLGMRRPKTVILRMSEPQRGWVVASG